MKKHKCDGCEFADESKMKLVNYSISVITCNHRDFPVGKFELGYNVCALCPLDKERKLK